MPVVRGVYVVPTQFVAECRVRPDGTVELLQRSTVTVDSSATSAPREEILVRLRYDPHLRGFREFDAHRPPRALP